MDIQAIGTVVVVGIPAVGGLVWLIRLEGRVNTQDVLHQEMKEDVQYIRQRIDAALNGHK